MTKGHAGSVEYFHSEGEFLAKFTLFRNRLELAPGDLETPEIVIRHKNAGTMDRVVDSGAGFQSAFGLEFTFHGSLVLAHDR